MSRLKRVLGNKTKSVSNIVKTKTTIMLTKKKEHKLSIVTASYNSEEYLVDYFNGFVKNSYKNLEIIFVDDGSIDNTKKIVESYQSKLNIKYIYQNNSGQANARNNGLEHITGDFVTFIDSDDFVNGTYFEEVNNVINYTKGKSIVSCNWINYIEDEKLFKDDHPLNYRFKFRGNYRMVNSFKSDGDFQLAMNSVFFDARIIKEHILKVPNVRPQFEDALFVNKYYLACNNFNITFAKSAKYFYRKRSSKDSTLNKARYNPEKYTGLLNHAYIALLELYSHEYKEIPKFVQNIVIYDLSWNIKELESSKLELSIEQRKIREQYLKKIFSYIDFDQISRNWKYLWKMYQIGINNKYYGNSEKIKAGAYYFYETNDYKKVQLISCDDRWQIIFNGKSHSLTELDYRVYEEQINGEFFINKYFLKVPSKNIKFVYDNEEIIFSNNRIDYEYKKFTFDSLCIFYDRQNKADDNAEVFYEYMLRNHSEYKNMYFAIDKDSKDYLRLEAKGFKLINYSSEEFINLYKKADYIISSGFDRKIENVHNMRYPSYESRSKFIFLQHGIITDDLKEWFSSKRVDKIVTSCDFEYNNLVNRYTFFEEEIIKTGLPRYDKLYNQPKNEILIQFTWRMQYQDYSTDQMKETKYYKDIIELLTSSKLKKVLMDSSYVVKFIPHPEVNKHIELFENISNDVIKILNIEDIKFRDQFASAKLMITDYSSVFTDFAYLRKKVIYLQSDIKEFYKGHLYDPEIDYEMDGLGPVVKSTNDLILEIESSIRVDCKVEEKYLDRIDNFFTFNDQNNCDRLFDELKKS